MQPLRREVDGVLGLLQLGHQPAGRGGLGEHGLEKNRFGMAGEGIGQGLALV